MEQGKIKHVTSLFLYIDNVDMKTIPWNRVLFHDHDQKTLMLELIHFRLHFRAETIGKFTSFTCQTLWQPYCSNNWYTNEKLSMKENKKITVLSFTSPSRLVDVSARGL